MRLRNARPGDAAAVTELERLCFGPDAWTLPMVVSELTGTDRDAVVALEEEVLVGYAMTMGSGDVVDLLRIAVRPERRRRGVARTLLRDVLRRVAAAGAERVLLEVRVGNDAARAFYAAAGFAEVARRPRYYRDGSDALLLGLSVQGTPAEAPRPGTRE